MQKFFGLDKRLAQAEVVAIKRELRASRASRSDAGKDVARVVQVPAVLSPPHTHTHMWEIHATVWRCGTAESASGMCSARAGFVQETGAATRSSSLLGVC